MSILGLLLLYSFQGKLLYPVPDFPVLRNLPENVVKIDLEISYAYLLTPSVHANQKLPLLIYTHGNGELADMWINRFEHIINNRIAVLIVEYPGYGNAAGETSLKTINATILEAFDKATALPFIDQNQVVAYGRSIGGGAASLLASQRPITALGLESTFSNLARLVSEKGLPSFLFKDRFDNLKIIQSLNIPVFIYHGTADKVIPISHGRTLKSAGKDITYHSAPCGHNDCPDKWPELIDFLIEKTDIELEDID